MLEYVINGPGNEALDERVRPCTCHHDDDPPRPCPRKYALSECRHAALTLARQRIEKLEEALRRARGVCAGASAKHVYVPDQTLLDEIDRALLAPATRESE